MTVSGLSKVAQQPSLRLLGDDVERAVAAAIDLASGLIDAHAWEPLKSMCHEHMGTGGKRSRIRLCLEVATALEVSLESCVPLAAAVELLHNATLVHDDLQDQDTVRRGKPTLWARHGAEQAITAGDLLLMLPALAIEDDACQAQVALSLVHAVHRRGVTAASGQALEWASLSTAPDWATYTRICRGKTGALFALPVEGVLLLADWPRRRAREVGDWAASVGTLFQIHDDLIDLWGDKGRGQWGNDLREGKPSALTAAHLELHPQDKGALTTLLSAPRDQTTDEDVTFWRDRLAKAGALQLVVHRANLLHDRMTVGAESWSDDSPVLAKALFAFADKYLDAINEYARIAATHAAAL